MKDAVKNYLEEQIKTDEALAKVYDAAKIDKCISYITEQARKQLKGNNGAIADTVVYKWARDFYYGDLNTETKSEVKNVEQNAGNINEPSDEPTPVKKMTIQAVIQDEPKKEKSFTTMAEIDVIRGKKKASKKKKDEKPVDDGQLMFDF